MSEVHTMTGDQLMMQYLGASVLLCWHELPRRMQELILDQANDAVGIVPAPMIRDQIASFLVRRGGQRRARERRPYKCRAPAVQPSLSIES